MSLGYVSEQLAAAVITLASGAGSLNERLHNAAMSCHTLHDPHQQKAGFPPAEYERFDRWFDELSSGPNEWLEDTHKSGSAALGASDAKRLAEELVSIYAAVHARYVLAHPEAFRE